MGASFTRPDSTDTEVIGEADIPKFVLDLFNTRIEKKLSNFVPTIIENAIAGNRVNTINTSINNYTTVNLIKTLRSQRNRFDDELIKCIKTLFLTVDTSVVIQMDCHILILEITVLNDKF